MGATQQYLKEVRRKLCESVLSFHLHSGSRDEAQVVNQRQDPLPTESSCWPQKGCHLDLRSRSFVPSKSCPHPNKVLLLYISGKINK